jgi:chloride channel protein, CIC family
MPHGHDKSAPSEPTPAAAEDLRHRQSTVRRSLRARLGRAAARSLPGTRSSEALSVIVTASLVGALAGLAAVAFDVAVRVTVQFLREVPLLLGPYLGTLTTVLTPALGGLLVAPIVARWSPDVRGSGIPAVMYAVSNLGGKVPRRLAFWRPLASILSIGSGASLGTEGPVVQLSASVSSILAQAMHLNDERRRTLVAVAAAGGIAATFNTPIAGVLFAVEVILGEFQARFFSSIVIGAVTATAVSRSILGDAPAFSVPDYGLASPAELPLYLVLGLVAAVASVLFTRTFVGSENVFNRLRLPPMLRPAVGGLVVGLLALVVPQVLGRGYETIELLLQGGAAPTGMLLIWLAAKLLASGASFGSWGAGGIFAPVLFIGTAVGAAFGQGMQELWPGLGIAPGAFALVGMAAVLSGVTAAPMSSIVMVFELSGSYDLILPLLLAAVISTLVSDVFRQESIYHVMLSRRGQTLFRLREIDLLQTVRVREVMDEVPQLFAEQTLADLAERATSSHHHGFLVSPRASPGKVFGIVTLSDMERARTRGLVGTTPLSAIATRDVATARPDETAGEVLERMARIGIGRMPVVDPAKPDVAIGFVRQSDLARAYYKAVQRERVREQASEELRLRDLTGQEIVEVRVPRGSPLAHRTLRDARLPPQSIVVAIRRGNRTLFPHGDTTIEPGDTVVASVAVGFSPTFRSLFQGGR